MPASDDEIAALKEKLDYLGGRLHALVGFATAVITSHPHPTMLARHLEKAGEINFAMAETAVVSDSYVEGVQDIQNRLRQAVETTLAQQKPPDKA